MVPILGCGLAYRVAKNYIYELFERTCKRYRFALKVFISSENLLLELEIPAVKLWTLAPASFAEQPGAAPFNSGALSTR
jgi:hypothetical protein